MTNQTPDHPDLERYLDGLLADAARKEFEDTLANDPDLKAIVAQARADDTALKGSLNRSFNAPDQNTIENILNAATNHTTPQTSAPIIARINWVRRWAVAAVLLMGLAGTWMIFDYATTNQTPDPYDIGPHQTIPELFARAEAGNFDYWMCKDEKEFATTFYQNFAHAAQLDPDLPGAMNLLGLCFVDSISQNTMVLGGVAGPNADPVIMIIDKLNADDGSEFKTIDPATGLKIPRRAAPPFVFYEVSKLDQTYFLDALNPIEMPTQWIPGWGRLQENQDPDTNNNDQ